MKRIYGVLVCVCICLSVVSCKSKEEEKANNFTAEIVDSENSEDMIEEESSPDSEINEMDSQSKDENQNKRKDSNLGDLDIEESSKKEVKEKKREKNNNDNNNNDNNNNDNDFSVEESTKPVAGDITGDNTYVDEEHADAGDDAGYEKVDRIFLDYVNLITADFPLNKTDKILADISAPIIKEYGNIDYIYGMTDYTTKKDCTTFIIEGKDRRKFKVTIKEKGTSYTVTVTEIK